MDPNRILHSSQSSSPLAGAAAAAGLGFGRIQWEDDGDLHRYDAQRNDAVGGPEPPRGEWREPMFEKPLTPSDVGKLNRLVIPKQHAEKHFPLGGGSGAGAEKEVLLSFEDESGKPWRFRYSYWNSSQSYVLTKGWSRFVKEKRLDAGDVVLFEKHRRDRRRLFIGWRRCAERRAQDSEMLRRFSPCGPSGGGAWTTAGAFYSTHPYPPNPLAPYHHHNRLLDHSLHAGPAIQVQTTPSVGSPKRLRLFGVNLECQPDGSEPSLHDGSSGLSHGSVHEPFFTPIPNPRSHMDMNFSRDGN